MTFSEPTEALITALQEKHDRAAKAKTNADEAARVAAAAKVQAEQATRERDAAAQEVQAAKVEAMRAIERELSNPPAKTGDATPATPAKPKK